MRDKKEKLVKSKERGGDRAAPDSRYRAESENPPSVGRLLSNKEKLVKSKDRVRKHGEVFTPAVIVSQMLDMLEEESRKEQEDVWAPCKTFLDPACGNGNFLVQIIERKIGRLVKLFDGSRFGAYDYLWALATTYGVELLPDNASECRERLFNTWLELTEKFAGTPSDETKETARRMLELNIINASFLDKNNKELNRDLPFYSWKMENGKFVETRETVRKDGYLF